MSTIKLIISDLHLADGDAILDGFGDYQQSALEGLLNVASGRNKLGPYGYHEANPFSQADDVELVINGDGFDFLATPAYETKRITNAPIALEKLEKIITAHRPFFEALRHFIDRPGRHVTFITGNHDLELCLQDVQGRIWEAMGLEHLSSALKFCPTPSYRPLPDVYVEHGNEYDFWNQFAQGFWDEQDVPENAPHSSNLRTITLSAGSQYFQHASLPLSLRYPYLDHFEPSMNSIRQIALLCLLDPEIVMETARRVMELLSEPRKALTNLAPGEERIPAKLFEQAMVDFAAFQQDTAARKTNWTEPPSMENTQAQGDAATEFTMLRDALAGYPQGVIPDVPLQGAVAAICRPSTYMMGEGVATGMHNVLSGNPELRYAIAGHTHMVRIDPINNGTQAYLNTGTWTRRLALPAPGEMTPALVEWLRQPDWQNVPLRDVTQLTFAMVNASANGPSRASLCVWEGGSKGSYRILA